MPNSGFRLRIQAELAFQSESVARTPIHTPPPGSFTMFSARILSTLGILAFTSLVLGQAPPPTAYTITSALAGPEPGTMTVYRNGSMALIELNHPAKPDGTPANRSLTLYDLKAMASFSWDPATTPRACSAGRFSGDWGNPFAMTTELSASIAKGDLKPTGSEALNGIATDRKS